MRKIALIAMLTALCVVGRTAFMFLLNVQPVTTIFIIITIYLGFIPGLTVAILSMLISNFYMGMGIWTIAQIISFAFVVLIAFLLSKFSIFRRSLILQAIYALIAGFLYGFIISLVQAPIMGIAAFWPYYLAGVSADAMHGFGNLQFYLILGPILKKLFMRTKICVENSSRTFGKNSLKDSQKV